MNHTLAYRRYQNSPLTCATDGKIFSNHLTWLWHFIQEMFVEKF